MKLNVDLIPPKPDRTAICERIPPRLSPRIPPYISEDVFNKLHPNLQKHCDDILRVLETHKKTPIWTDSRDDIVVACNFHHTFRIPLRDIYELNVRCPKCKLDIANISRDIYSSGQVNSKVFRIIRINRFGQLTLKCVEKDHKCQITFVMPCSPAEEPPKNNVPDFCPECIADSAPTNRMKIRFPALSLSESSGDDVHDSDGVDRYLEHRTRVNFDLDMEDDMDPDFSADHDFSHDPDLVEYDSDPGFLARMFDDNRSGCEHKSRESSPRAGCCLDTDDAFESYFDDMEIEDIRPKRPVDSIGRILDSLISQNREEYEKCRAMAHDRVRNEIEKTFHENPM